MASCLHGLGKFCRRTLFLEQTLKYQLNLDFRVGLVGFPAEGSSLLLKLPYQTAVSGPQPGSVIIASLRPVVVRHSSPQARRVLVGTDIHQGAIEVENTVPIPHALTRSIRVS